MVLVPLLLVRGLAVLVLVIVVLLLVKFLVQRRDWLAGTNMSLRSSSCVLLHLVLSLVVHEAACTSTMYQ
jgi:hypothetical protein